MSWYKNITKIAEPLPDAIGVPEKFKQMGPYHLREWMPGDKAKEETKKHPDLSYIGHGNSGIAYQTRADQAVKYTVDEKEYNAAVKVMDIQKTNPNTGIARIYDARIVHKTPRPVSIKDQNRVKDVYAIVMEKLAPLSQQETIYIDRMSYIWSLGSTPVSLKEVFFALKEDFDLHTLQSKSFLDCHKKYMKLADKIRSIGAGDRDVHHLNIGYDKKGEYAILDLGSIYFR